MLIYCQSGSLFCVCNNEDYKYAHCSYFVIIILDIKNNKTWNTFLEKVQRHMEIAKFVFIVYGKHSKNMKVWFINFNEIRITF